MPPPPEGRAAARPRPRRSRAQADEASARRPRGRARPPCRRPRGSRRAAPRTGRAPPRSAPAAPAARRAPLRLVKSPSASNPVKPSWGAPSRRRSRASPGGRLAATALSHLCNRRLLRPVPLAAARKEGATRGTRGFLRFQKTGPLSEPRQLFGSEKGLAWLDVRCLQAFIALHDVELDLLTLGQRLVAFPCNRREMDEHVFAAFALDEAVALLVREPLDGALGQTYSLRTNTTTARAPSRRPTVKRREP